MARPSGADLQHAPGLTRDTPRTALATSNRANYCSDATDYTSSALVNVRLGLIRPLSAAMITSIADALHLLGGEFSVMDATTDQLGKRFGRSGGRSGMIVLAIGASIAIYLAWFVLRNATEAADDLLQLLLSPLVH